MAYREPPENFDADDGDGDEVDDYYEDEHSEDDEDEPTVQCPYCRQQIHEEAQRCPYCERYISIEDAPSRKPWWLLAGVAICIYIVFSWFL